MTVADITLQVEPLTTSGTISALDDTILKAQATLVSGKVNRVWAVIRPPQMDIIVDDTGIPLLAFPNTSLGSSKTEENVWEGIWNGFVYNGEYEITFYAEDNEHNIESSSSIKLNVRDGIECPVNASVHVGINNEIYNLGDSPGISVTENLAYGYDLYIALIMPDSRFVTFQESNRLSQEFNKPDKWWDTNRIQVREITVLDDMSLLEGFPKGQYWVYAILSPEREEILSSVSNWVVDAAGFEIK